MRKRRNAAPTSSAHPLAMHDPDQGFLYFTAGVASWRPHPQQHGRWLLRVDVVCHEPMEFLAASDRDALQLAEKMADGFESGLALDLIAVGFTSSGRTLYGSLPTKSTAAAVSCSEKALRLT